MPTRTAVLALAVVLGCCSFGEGQFLKDLAARINTPLTNSLSVAFTGNQLIFNIPHIPTPDFDALTNSCDAFLYGTGNRHRTSKIYAPARAHWGKGDRSHGVTCLTLQNLIVEESQSSEPIHNAVLQSAATRQPELSGHPITVPSTTGNENSKFDMRLMVDKCSQAAFCFPIPLLHPFFFSFPVPLATILETGKICTRVRWVGLDYSDAPGTGIHITRARIAKSSQANIQVPHPLPAPQPQHNCAMC